MFDGESAWRARWYALSTRREDAALRQEILVALAADVRRLPSPPAGWVQSLPPLAQVARLFSTHLQRFAPAHVDVRVTAIVHVPRTCVFHVKFLCSEVWWHDGHDGIDSYYPAHKLSGDAVYMATVCAEVRLAVNARGHWVVAAHFMSDGRRQDSWPQGETDPGSGAPLLGSDIVVNVWLPGGRDPKYLRAVGWTAFNLHDDDVLAEAQRAPATSSVNRTSSKEKYKAEFKCTGQQGTCLNVLSQPPALLLRGTASYYPLVRPLPLCRSCRLLVSAAFADPRRGSLPLSRVYRINSYEYDVMENAAAHWRDPRTGVVVAGRTKRHYRIRLRWWPATPVTPVGRYVLESYEARKNRVVLYSHGAEDNC